MDLEPTDDQLAMAAGLARLCADLVTPEAAGPRPPCRAPWTGTCGAPSATSAPSPSPSPARAASASGWPRPRWCSRSWARPPSPDRWWARSWPPGCRRRRATWPSGPWPARRWSAWCPSAARTWSSTGPPSTPSWWSDRPASGWSGTPGPAPRGPALDPLTPVEVVATCPRATRSAMAATPPASGVSPGCWRLPSRWAWPAAVAMATDHATTRTQFGRVIGSFQALKHLLADATVAVEVARAAVQAAGVAIDEGGEGGPGGRRRPHRGVARRRPGPPRLHPGPRRHGLHAGTSTPTCTSSGPWSSARGSATRTARSTRWPPCSTRAPGRRRRRRGR